jgi:predicted patatin/cPLA2 family phospholipase
MWKYIFDMGRRLLLLVEDTQRHGDAIKEMQREVRELATLVERLAYESHRTREWTEHQHEVTKLELKNEMLRFRQQLAAESSSVEEPES